MVLFSYLLFPFLLFITLNIQKIQNKHYDFKYFNSAILALFGTAFLLIINFNKLNTEHFQFLKDYKFYIAQFLSIIYIIIQVKTRKYNEHNLNICYFANFLSIAIIPFVSILLMYLFKFENTIEIKYDNFYDVILLSVSLFILSFIFYLDKIKNKSINKINWLFASFLVGAFSVVFSSKLMQEYDPTNYMIVATFLNLIAFLIISFFKEINTIKKIKSLNYSLIKHKSNYFFMVLGYCITLNINIFIISNIAAEHYSIVRNVGIILINYFYSYFYEKVNIVNVKDSVVLFLIISVLIIFTT